MESLHPKEGICDNIELGILNAAVYEVNPLDLLPRFIKYDTSDQPPKNFNILYLTLLHNEFFQTESVKLLQTVFNLSCLCCLEALCKVPALDNREFLNLEKNIGKEQTEKVTVFNFTLIEAQLV